MALKVAINKFHSFLFNKNKNTDFGNDDMKSLSLDSNNVNRFIKLLLGKDNLFTISQVQ